MTELKWSRRRARVQMRSVLADVSSAHLFPWSGGGVRTLNLRCVIYHVHDELSAVEKAVISTVLTSPVDVVLSRMILPDKSNLSGTITGVRWWYCVLAIVFCLWSGQFLLREIAWATSQQSSRFSVSASRSWSHVRRCARCPEDARHPDHGIDHPCPSVQTQTTHSRKGVRVHAHVLEAVGMWCAQRERQWLGSLPSSCGDCSIRTDSELYQTDPGRARGIGARRGVQRVSSRWDRTVCAAPVPAVKYISKSHLYCWSPQ